jgi:hypothetical protein
VGGRTANGSAKELTNAEKTANAGCDPARRLTAIQTQFKSIAVKMGGTGPALLQKTREIEDFETERSIFVATGDGDDLDPQLSYLISAWSELPDSVRRHVLDLVRACKSADQQS